MSAPIPGLGLCMIVRNGAESLGQALQSVQGAVQELIIVDTGSHDQSLEIARRFGAQVAEFSWCDDFSQARNYALSLASSEWILLLDADEQLQPESLVLLRQLLPNLPAGPVVVRGLECTPGQRPTAKRILHRRWPGLGFAGRVHEQLSILDAQAAGQELIELEFSQLRLLHRRPAEAERQAKARWYLQLIEAELATGPDARRRSELGSHQAQSLLILNDLPQALEALRRASADYSLSGLKGRLGELLLVHQLLVLLRLQRLEDCGPLCQRLMQAHPERPEGWYYGAYLSFWHSNFAQAEALLARAQGAPELERELLRARLELLTNHIQQGHHRLKALLSRFKREDLRWHYLRACVLQPGGFLDPSLMPQPPENWLQLLPLQAYWSPAESAQLKATLLH